MPIPDTETPEERFRSRLEATETKARTSDYVRILLISAAAALLAYLATFLLHPRYQSTETLYFPMSNDDTSNPLSALRASVKPGDPGSVPLVGGSVTSPEVGSSKDTALAILSSTSCLKYAIEKNDLTRVYNERMSRALKTLRGRLDVTIDKNGLIQMQVTDEDPQRAANILDSLREALLQMSNRLTVNVSRSNRQFIQDRVALAQRNYDRRKADLSAALLNYHFGDLQAVEKALREYEGKREDADLKAKTLRSQIAETEAGVKTIIGQSGTFAGDFVALSHLYPSLSTLLQEMQKRNLAKADAKNDYNPKSVQVEDAELDNKASGEMANGIIDRRRNLMSKGADPSTLSLSAQLRATETAELELATRVAAAKRVLAEATHESVELQSKKRDLSLATEELNLLQKELELARIAEIRDPSRFEVVDPAEPADETVFPKRGLTAGIVFVLVLVGQVLPRLFGRTDAEPSPANSSSPA